MLIALLACRADPPVVHRPVPDGPAPAGSPVDRHGRLRVDGLQLVDADGAPVKLHGVSDQGIQWFPWGTCLNAGSLAFLTDPDQFGIDVVRIPVYVTEGGWLRDPQEQTDRATELVDEAIERGLYAVLDWHVTSFDPNDHLDEAEAFWELMATTYAGVPNLLYEIANEPSHCRWSAIADYADRVIPSIRGIDPDVPVIVGTPDDSADLGGPADAPLSAENVLYTYHLYAASMDPQQIAPFLGRIPLFVTEWGASSYSGDSPDDYDGAARFLEALDGPDQQVSWVAWSFTDDSESSAMLRRGTCPQGPWTAESLSTSGRFVRDRLR